MLRARSLVFLLSLLIARAAWAQTPDMDGPLSSSIEVDTITVGPSQVSTTVCLPSGGSPWPVVAIAYPTLESASSASGLCLHLATYGILAVIPDEGFANTDYASVATTLLGSLAYFQSENARKGSQFNGLIDSVHRGVLGLSAAGVGALLAAEQDPTLSAAVVLDPEDYNGLADNVAATPTVVPILSLRANPDVCNNQGNWDPIFTALTGPRSTLHVYASNLCDAEAPPSTACTTACGATYAYAATMFSRYATADILYFVGCQQSMRTWIDGPGLQSDLQMHSLDTSAVADLPFHCGPYVTVDAGSDPGTDGGTAEATGCGCTSESTRPTWVLLLLVGCGVWASRRTPGANS